MDHHDPLFQWTRRIAATLPPAVQERLFGPVLVTPEMMRDAFAQLQQEVLDLSRTHGLDAGRTQLLRHYAAQLSRQPALASGGRGEDVFKAYEATLGELMQQMLSIAMHPQEAQPSNLDWEMTPLYMHVTAKLGECIAQQNPRFGQYAKKIQSFQTKGPVSL